MVQSGPYWICGELSKTQMPNANAPVTKLTSSPSSVRHSDLILITPLRKHVDMGSVGCDRHSGINGVPRWSSVLYRPYVIFVGADDRDRSG